MHRRWKIMGRSGLVVVFQKSHHPVLKGHVSPEVAANRGGISCQETVVQLFVITIVKALAA
jgi:hypothetical protein